MKKLYKLLSLFLLVISLTVLNGCKIKLNPGPFDQYTASIFKSIVLDEMNLNFLFEDRAAFGLDEELEPSLPTPKSSNSLGNLLINMYFGQMSYYEYDTLNDDEQITYLLVNNLLDNINAIKPEMSYMDNSYLGSYLGYQAQLPLLFSEYHFRNLKDIDNYFIFMDLVPKTFKAYVDYEKEKAEKGFGMPDFVINKVIAQCDAFLSNVENHFLIETFSKRLREVSFLSEEQIDAYVLMNAQKVNGPLAEGYRYIKDNLGDIYGLATNNLGLSYYDNGKEYYTILFKDTTGYDIKIEDAIAYMDAIIDERLTNLYSLVQANPQISELLEDLVLMDNDPLSQLYYFKDQLSNHFPELSYIPEIEVKYIDASMEDHFSPAAYMVSAIDNITREFVYLNNKSIGDDYNYLYTTLAHEGFPGHMYQNIYFKGLETNPLRKVLKSNGYVEGWATYAQMYSYNFLTDIDPVILEFLKLNDEINGAVTSRMDMGIHYEGWDITELLTFLRRFGNYTEDRAEQIIQQLVEVPTNSQGYYFSYFKLADMYEYVSSTLGSEFNPILYHKAILDCGPIPLRFVEERVKKALIIQ